MMALISLWIAGLLIKNVSSYFTGSADIPWPYYAKDLASNLL